MSQGKTNDHLNLRAKIERWLEEEGISFNNVTDLNSFFHIQANLKNATIHVSESKVRFGVLAVQGALELSADQLQKYQIANLDDRKLLFRTLFVMLDKSEYHFLLQEDFTTQNWLRIERALYIEDLTRSRLLDGMKDLNVRLVNINYLLNDSLATFKPVSDNPQMYD